MRVLHPVVDEWGADYAIFATGVSTVRLTEPFADFLESAAAEQRRPVLVTPVHTRVSAFVSLAMRRAGGFWAVQKPTGEAYDALSGYRIEKIGDLWERMDSKRSRLAVFDGPGPGIQRALTFDVHVHHRAANSTLLGGLAQEAVRGLGAGELDVWGTHEPMIRPWDTGAVTGQVKAEMPESGVLHASGLDGSFCDIQVWRTRHGLLEHTQGGVPTQTGTWRLADYVRAASDFLESIAERRNPTIGFVSLSEWDGGMTQRVRLRAPESPLSVLIGAKAVRDLGLDVAELVNAHDVIVVGRAKTPSVIVRFADPVRGLWEQLASFAASLDPQRLAKVIGRAPTNDPDGG